MSALTLIEAAKMMPGDSLNRAVIEMYAGSSDILLNLPFENISGNAKKFNREKALPNVGFRGVNEGYTTSHANLDPQTESLVITGGDLDVDKFIVDTQGGMEQRAYQEAAQIRSLSLAWTNKFIKGDVQSNNREFNGLQVRVSGSQKIAAGNTANGSALSLEALDEAIDQTLNPTHLIMNKAMRRRLTQAARNPNVSGYITYEKDAFGRSVTKYNDLPILIVDLDHTNTEILPFTEAATSGTATATSIYVVSFGPNSLMGLQNGNIDARDLGELDTAPVYRTRVEWYTNFAVYNQRAVTRLWSIADAAVVA